MSAADGSPVDRYPAGALNVNGFSLFNAVGFQITLGAPIILFANSLGASATVLGIIASFTPLMTVFQLPAAQFLPVYGYKRFMLMGWGFRTIFIFVLALVPLMAFLDSPSKLAVVLTSLFLFNLLRGIGSCAFYPWITELIPEAIRGRFLSRDQFFVQTGCLLALGVSAYVMDGKVDPWEYSLVFGISAFGQLVSLYFLRRIPDVPAGEVSRRSSQSVPWRAIVAYKPFLTLVWFNVLFMGIIGGLGVFTVEYLKNTAGLSASLIMVLSSAAFIAAMLSLPFTSMTIDHVGSKVILRLALGIFGFAIAGWCLVAGSVLPPSMGIVATLTFCGGLAGANFNIANIRMAMSIMPVMGRNHFFALFTVIASLGLGLSPILWGLILDAIGDYQWVGTHFIWQRHSIYFAILFILGLVAFISVSRLREGNEVVGDVRLYEARMRRFGRDWMR